MNKVYQAQWLGLWTRSCLYAVWMYVLDLSCASPASLSPLKHHTMGKQWYSTQTIIPTEPASQSPTPLCWALSRDAKPQILMSFFFCLTRPGNEPPTSCMPGERSTTTMTILPGCGHREIFRKLTTIRCKRLGFFPWHHDHTRASWKAFVCHALVSIGLGCSCFALGTPQQSLRHSRMLCMAKTVEKSWMHIQLYLARYPVISSHGRFVTTIFVWWTDRRLMGEEGLWST